MTNSNSETSGSDNLPDSQTIFMGKYKTTTLSWRILATDNNSALLILDQALCAMPFNTELQPTNWTDSTLRCWLNHDFLNNSFNQKEQNQIIKKQDDSIFLLSIEEAELLFKDAGHRKCSVSASSDKNIWRDDSNSCWWWLRRNGVEQNLIAFVEPSGEINKIGDCADYTNYAVRPALWISLN